MAATDFIVAIELGSSKITGIAGKKHADRKHTSAGPRQRKLLFYP